MELAKVTRQKAYDKIRGEIEAGMIALAKREDISYTFYGEKNIHWGCDKCTYIGRLEFPTSFHHLDDEVTIIVAPRTLPLGDGFGVGYDVRLGYSEFGYDSVSEMIVDMKENPEEFFCVSLEEAYAKDGATDIPAKIYSKQKFMKKLNFEDIESGFDKELEELTDDIEDIIIAAVGSQHGSK